MTGLKKSTPNNITNVANILIIMEESLDEAIDHVKTL